MTFWRNDETQTDAFGSERAAEPTEKTRAAMKDFSLKHSAVFLPISKSRRQLWLDTSLTSREGQ
jgi:hypothetical protein